MRKILLLWIFLLLLTLLILTLFFTSCASTGVESFAWKNHQPASIAKNEVNFTYRGDFNNLDDFLRRIKLNLTFLKKQGYEIIKIEYKYGQDMTQKTIVCFAVVHYKRKK